MDRLQVEQLKSQLAALFAILVGRSDGKGIVAATFNPEFYAVTYKDGKSQVTIRMDWDAMWSEDTA